MSWLIVGLLGLVLLACLVVFTGRVGGYRRPADDTLVTDLLGPPKVSAVPALRAGEKAEPPPAPQARQESEPTPPAGAGDWLETQLAWIAAWSQQMHQEIESAGRPEPNRNE